MSFPLRDNHRCFVCGDENPIGLKLTFQREGGLAVAEIVLADVYQGFFGLAHGGIAGAMLDEAMWYALESVGFLGLTAELNVRYLQPVPVGESLRVEARVGEVGRRLGEATASLQTASSVVAKASGKFLRWKEGVEREGLGGKPPPDQALRS